MIALLLTLYPAQWRHRYGEEFRAVLESRPLGPFDVADVLLGALDARLTPSRLPGTASGGTFMLLRIGGLGAVLGGITWFIGLAVASGLGDVDGARPWVGVLLLGTLGLLVALIGLSAFQGHRDPALAWVAFVIPGAGALASAIGTAGMLVLPENGSVLGMWSPWELWIIGLATTMIGSMFFAIATYQARVLSTRAARALGISSAATLLFGFTSTLMESWGTLVPLLIVACVGSFAASWVWLGISALRRGPIRQVQPA